MAKLINTKTGEELTGNVPIKIKSWHTHKLTIVIGHEFELLLTTSQADWLMNYFRSIRNLKGGDDMT
jgi:hypothetical protein